MWNKEENCLIKIEDEDCSLQYWVAHKETRTITLFDDIEQAKCVIARLLEDGAEAYANFNEFYKKYPPFTLEERVRMTEEWLKKALNSKN